MYSLLAASEPPRFSPLVLADQLLVLAQEAGRAGLPAAADRLIALAFDVCDEKAAPTPRRTAARC